MSRRTKVVATIGPASNTDEVIAAMIEAGMDVARISLAHTPLEEAIEIHRRVRAAADRLDAVVATMVDLPGPMIRIGRPPKGGIVLEAGAEIELVVGTGPSTAERVAIEYPHLIDDCTVGDRLSFGDGAHVVVEVESKDASTVRARVVSGGPLVGRAGVSIPFVTNDLGAVSDIHVKEVERFVEEGVDMVALSVRSAAELRSLALEPYPRGPMLIAKLESALAIEELESIIGAASAVMVARGGLGMDLALEELPWTQKHIIRDCIVGGLPVVTAGQMLESMVTAPTPTRAEATDVANAVFDGSSGVMLSAETAIGAWPAESVATMARIAETADDEFDQKAWAQQVAELRMTGHDEEALITDAITIAAAGATQSMNLRALICVSESGFTVRSMARFRPAVPILGFSPNPRTVRQLASSWGVVPRLLETESHDYQERVRVALIRAKRDGNVAPGDIVGVVAGLSKAARATDTFRLMRVT